MTPVRGDGLLHPGVVLAIVLLAVNDQWAKAAWPGLLTGKLSDFAGLAAFPLFLQAGWEWVDRRRPFRPSRAILVTTCVATAVVFVLVKTWPPAHALYEHGLGWLQWPVKAAWARLQGLPAGPPRPVHLEADPTDLVALPSVLLAAWMGWGRGRPRPEGGSRTSQR